MTFAITVLGGKLPEYAQKNGVKSTDNEPTHIGMKKVCVVAPVHVWDDARVFHKESCTLADAGNQVTLIARIESPRTINAIEILPPAGSSGNRFTRFLSLPLVGVQALRKNADIYHLHNPDTLPLAVLLRLLGKTVIYDTHEDFTRRILIRSWIPGRLRRPLAFLVRKAEALVSALVSASIATQQDVADRLNGTVLLLGNPPRVNDALMEAVQRHANEVADQDGHLRAVYIGRVNRPRGLDEMVDAMEIANRTTPVRLWLIGPADIDDLDRARSRTGWQHVDYIPKIQQELALAHVDRADVGLVVLRDVGGHAEIDPNKLYEYMMLGKPFIASAFESWMNRLSGIDAGWFVRPGSADEIAAALVDVADDRELAAKKGAAGRTFSETYNWETESRKLLDLYSAL